MKLHYNQLRMKLIITILLLVSLSIYSQESLRLLSWNIQNLGQEKTSEQVEQIASVLCDYDLVAIQQIDAKGQSGENAVNRLINVLNRKGEQWEFIISKPTKTRKKDRKRYAFLWKSNQVEIVDKAYLMKTIERKVKNEPFVMTISWEGQLISIVNYLAKNYKKHPEKEIKSVLDYLDQIGNAYLLMGSFNTQYSFDGKSNLLSVTNHQNTFLRSYCKYGTNAYLALDNICYTANDFELISSGVLDYVGGCENIKTALQISNHLPVVAHIKLKNIYEPVAINKVLRSEK